MTMNQSLKLAEAQKIHEIVIMHDELRQIYEVLKETINITEILLGEGKIISPDSICLTGNAGTGKTTLSKILMKEFPKKVIIDQDLEIQTHPILFTSIQGKSVNGLAKVMLAQLGDHSAKNINEKTGLTERLKRQLKSARTNLIIFDEFHELLTDKNRKEVLGWVKALINATGIPILLMGTPGVESLIETNDEDVRRILKLYIGKLDYAYDQPSNQFYNYVTSLVDVYKKKLGFKSFYGFEKNSDFLRIFLATNGYPSNIAELFKNAAKAAIREGSIEVTINHLATGFNFSKNIDLLIGNHNPFKMKIEDAYQLHRSPITSVSK
ncbi:NACHT domain-containing protein [Methylophaga sp. SB9B]|nr:NACHT domain-containing protein [Methylophaga sp. SB9B]